MRGGLACVLRGLALLAPLCTPGCGVVQPDGPDAATFTTAAARTLAPCRAALAAPEALSSIEAVVQHINSLPQPATVACFLASLPRPLGIVATTSVTSAQPSVGPRAPRIFILTPALTLSVVPEGEGAPLLEFGAWIDARRSLKGEVLLPPTEPLAPSAPYDRVRLAANSGTSCGYCHREESEAAGRPGVFASVAFQPMSYQLVSLERVRTASAAGCTGANDVTPRCLFWRALFDYGEVQQGAFDSRVDTIFR